MVLIQHLFGIPSLRQTHREIQVNLAYRWFLGYGLLDEIPHFATVSYAFCKRFPDELTSEIFEHILNKALNNKMLDPGAIFIDGTHIKASANKKKFQKEQVAKAAKVYSGQLRREVNEEREKLGKKPIEDEDDENHPQGGGGETVEKTVSTTDPDCGMFVKGEHERQFAYEAHTACDKRGFVLGVEVTAGNVHDSVAWDKVYDDVTEKFKVQFVTMDAGYDSVDFSSQHLLVCPYCTTNAISVKLCDFFTADCTPEKVGIVVFDTIWKIEQQSPRKLAGFLAVRIIPLAGMLFSLAKTHFSC